MTINALQNNAKMLVDGQWIESSDKKTMKSYNPATGEDLGDFPEATRQDVQRAVQAADEAKNRIASKTLWERSALLLQIAAALEDKKEEVAKVISLEEGKPFHSEAIGEVGAAIQGFKNAAEQVKWIEGSTIPVEDPAKRAFNFYQPRGIYAVISPFNFPVNIPVEYIAPAIAAGNTIVWIPAPSTSLTALKLAEIIQPILPKGVLNVVTGKGEIVGDELVGHPLVNGIGFTGSTSTGNIIAKRGAGKAQTLELGGNGPTIILEDADIDSVATSVFYGCFVNAGQTCSATERILIHESLQETFIEKLKEKIEKEVVLGDPLNEETTMGPLHNNDVATKMDLHIKDAVEKGAKVVHGGKRAEGYKTSLFYEPTVIKNCSPDSLVNLEETFGPIAPLITFKTKEEALELSMQGNYGLLASVFTNNPKDAFFFAESLKTGIVNINEHSNYWELHVPFGGGSGTKSGSGRIGGMQAIKAMSALKTVSWNIK